MIYGWTDDDAIGEWIVLNLGELFRHRLHEGRREYMNHDGTTAFIAIPLWDIAAKPRVIVDIEVHSPTNLVMRGSVYPVVPCPKCGERAYHVGPKGMPERRCWRCGNIWTPEIGETA
jgi:hypothetical protein